MPADIDSTQKERVERELLALDRYNFTYRFNSKITDASVQTCIDKIESWRRANPDNEVMLALIDCRDGDESAARRLAGYLREHEITTHGQGHCSYAGNVILQAGRKRSMDKSAWILAGLPADWVDVQEALRRGLVDEVR